MSASTLITDYIGYGTAAARPATPLTPTGCMAGWFATDTLRLSVWNGAWQNIVGPATTDTLTNKTISGGTVDNAPIGGTTANSGKFTTLSASGVVSGVGFSNYFASPPSIGSVARGTGAFISIVTTLDASLHGLTFGRGGSSISTNTAVGVSALAADTTGDNNAAFGVNALSLNTTGPQNSAFGVNALSFNTVGQQNSAFGVNTLNQNSTGNYNSAQGVQALGSNTTGSANTAVGIYSLTANVSADNNVGFGASALATNTTGAGNTGVGTGTLQDLNIVANDGSGANTAIGYNTGRGIITGVNNTIIGANVTGLSAALSSSIILATGDGVIRTDFGKTNAGLWTDAAPRVSPTYTIGTLPSAVAGARCFVSNCSTAAAGVFGGIAATGTGSVFVPVYYDGSNWRVG